MKDFIARIKYGPGTAEWGEPENQFEVLLVKYGIPITGSGGGTDLGTGERDYEFEFTASPEQMAGMREEMSSLWIISEV